MQTTTKLSNTTTELDALTQIDVRQLAHVTGGKITPPPPPVTTNTSDLGHKIKRVVAGGLLIGSTVLGPDAPSPEDIHLPKPEGGGQTTTGQVIKPKAPPIKTIP